MVKAFLGVDVGGSGIKAAPVDVESGSLLAERARIDTPQPATPANVAEAVLSVTAGFDFSDRVGFGFPSVVDADGVVHTSMNIDESWIGVNSVELFSETLKCDVSVLNDADAAAIAEWQVGAAFGVMGTVIVVTFGTGIGSGVLIDGVLARNVELGVIELDGHWPAENYFSAKVRREESLEWDEWGARANRYLTHVNRVLAPDLIVFGGGVTKYWDEFSGEFDPSLPVRPAATGNDAGLIGAAIVASRV